MLLGKNDDHVVAKPTLIEKETEPSMHSTGLILLFLNRNQNRTKDPIHDLKR